MKKYMCPHCNAELYWDAQAKALKCEYCEHSFQPEELDELAEKAAAIKGERDKSTAEEKANREEHKAREASEQDKATDDSEKTNTDDLVVYACQNCGAEVITSKSTVATTCAFCGRAISLTNKLVGNFAPDTVIPFTIDEDKAISIYKTYASKGLLSPKEFKNKNQIKKLKGVYVPFWLHSYTEKSQVVVGAENMTSHKRGDDKVVDHHMYDIDMTVEGTFSSVPTDGLKNLDNNLMAAIEPFDYSIMSEFNPAYMAGFYAEEYDESSNETVAAAYERTGAVMESESLEKAGFYATKFIKSYAPSYEDETAKYAMLPVWLFNVDYKDKTYQFAVNGETGKIAGKLPISKLKVAAFAAASVAGTQLIALAVRLLATL